MKNIIRMIDEACNAICEPVSLLAEPTDEGYSLALVGVGSNETVTMQSDWKMDLAVAGETLEAAFKALDDLCAEDFAALGVVV